MSALIVALAVVAAGCIALNRWRRWEQQLRAESSALSSLSSRGDEHADVEAEADVWVSPAGLSRSRTESMTTAPSQTAAATLSATAPEAARGGTWGSPGARWPRWGLVATAAVLAVGATLTIGERPALLLYVYLGAVLLPLLVCDMRLHRLPTCFIAPAYPAAAVAFLADAVVTGEWSRLVHAVLGCAVLGGVYLVLCAMPGGLMGLGDVRLAGVLGAALAWISWEALLIGALGAFVLSFLVGLPQLLLRRTRLQSRVAFGPYMLIASVLAVAAGA